MADTEALGRISDARIYRHLVAGAIKVTEGEELKRISAVAAHGLGEENFHFRWTCNGGMAFFLAVPSRFVTNVESLCSPLTVALPDHPQHRGNGIYTFPDIPHAPAVAKRDDELVLISNDEIEALAKDYELPIHAISDRYVCSDLWIPGVYATRLQLERRAEKVIKASRWIIGISAVVYFLLAQNVLQSAKSWIYALGFKRDSLNEAVYSIQYSSPLTERLANFQKVSSIVVRAGGWLNSYTWRAGKETFDISLPGWISHDYVDALGPDAVADYSIPDNLVLVRKGDAAISIKR